MSISFTFDHFAISHFANVWPEKRFSISKSGCTGNGTFLWLSSIWPSLAGHARQSGKIGKLKNLRFKRDLSKRIERKKCWPIGGQVAVDLVLTRQTKRRQAKGAKDRQFDDGNLNFSTAKLVRPSEHEQQVSDFTTLTVVCRLVIVKATSWNTSSRDSFDESAREPRRSIYPPHRTSRDRSSRWNHCPTKNIKAERIGRDGRNSSVTLSKSGPLLDGKIGRGSFTRFISPALLTTGNHHHVLVVSLLAGS